MAREIGQCALCQAARVPLCKSHIIPKAIAKWAKSKALEEEKREFWDVNKRKLCQDFHHAPMFCERCEQRFSQRGEDKFIKRIFKPYQDNMQTEHTYDKWLRYYSVSEGWRLLHHLLELLKAGSMEDLSDKLLRHLRSSDTKAIYEMWRDYLLENRDDPGTAQYIYFFDYNYRQPGVNWAGGFALEAKYGQLIDAGPIFSDDRFALATQTFGILLISTVRPAEWPELEEAKIEPSGTLNIEAHGRPPELLAKWIHQRAQELKEYFNKTGPQGIWP